MNYGIKLFYGLITNFGMFNKKNSINCSSIHTKNFYLNNNLLLLNIELIYHIKQLLCFYVGI